MPGANFVAKSRNLISLKLLRERAYYETLNFGGIDVEEWGLHCVRESLNGRIVIFVHGFLSNGQNAWGEPSWPQMLAEDERSGVYVFTYKTSVDAGTFSVSDAVDNLHAYFEVDDLFRFREIVFVCHSMGGILARRFLLKYQRNFIGNGFRIGLFLIASPSMGSDAANLIALFSHVMGNIQAIDLRIGESNTWLNDINSDFLNLYRSKSIEIVGRELVEDKPTEILKYLGLAKKIVPAMSAAKYFENALRIPGSDHISIAKPGKKVALQYRVLKRFIEDMSDREEYHYLDDVNVENTQVAQRAMIELSENLEKFSDWQDAALFLQDALLETRLYIRKRRDGGARSAKYEHKLAMLWNEVGDRLRPYDSYLANLCHIKGQGWADPDLWSDPRFSDLPVTLNDMTDKLLHMSSAGSEI